MDIEIKNIIIYSIYLGWWWICDLSLEYWPSKAWPGLIWRPLLTNGGLWGRSDEVYTASLWASQAPAHGLQPRPRYRRPLTGLRASRGRWAVISEKCCRFPRYGGFIVGWLGIILWSDENIKCLFISDSFLDDSYKWRHTLKTSIDKYQAGKKWNVTLVLKVWSMQFLPLMSGDKRWCKILLIHLGYEDPPECFRQKTSDNHGRVYSLGIRSLLTWRFTSHK